MVYARFKTGLFLIPIYARFKTGICRILVTSVVRVVPSPTAGGSWGGCSRLGLEKQLSNIAPFINLS